MNPFKIIQISLWFSVLLIRPSIDLKAQHIASTSICDTIVLNSTTENEYDATVHSLYPNDNFCQDENTLASAWTIGGNPVVLRYFVKPPLPVLPTGTIINSAVLQFKYNPTTTILQGNSYYPGTPYNYLNDGVFCRVIQPWNPQTLTWNNQPQFTGFNMAWVPNSTSQTQNLTADITQLVNDTYVYPNNSFGFVFKMTTEDIYRCQVYASSNHPNIALHPTLILCYTTPASNGLNELNPLNNLQLNHLPQGGIQLINAGQVPIEKVALYSLQGACIETMEVHNTVASQTLYPSKATATGLYVLHVQTNKGNKLAKLLIW